MRPLQSKCSRLWRKNLVLNLFLQQLGDIHAKHWFKHCDKKKICLCDLREQQADRREYNLSLQICPWWVDSAYVVQINESPVLLRRHCQAMRAKVGRQKALKPAATHMPSPCLGRVPNRGAPLTTSFLCLCTKRFCRTTFWLLSPHFTFLSNSRKFPEDCIMVAQGVPSVVGKPS